MIGGLFLFGYAQNYYFHLRKFGASQGDDVHDTNSSQATTKTTRIKRDSKGQRRIL